MASAIDREARRTIEGASGESENPTGSGKSACRPILGVQ
jgi:hypothetical protein